MIAWRFELVLVLKGKRLADLGGEGSFIGVESFQILDVFPFVLSAALLSDNNEGPVNNRIWCFCLEMESTVARDHNKVETQGHLEVQLWPKTESGRNQRFGSSV